MISEAYNIDCKEFMRKLPRGAFDLIPADPPYFNGPETRGYYGSDVSVEMGVKRRKYDISLPWDLPDAEWFDLVKFVGKNLIIWGANYYDFIGTVHPTPRQPQLADWLKDHPRGWIVWDKCNGKSSFNDFELAWTNFDMPTVVYKQMWNGMQHGKSIFEGHIMQGNKKLNQKRIHTTEKPILLYKWLFHCFAKAGYKILDTHLGSGSSRIAAYDMEINFVGTELDDKMFMKQENRFNQYISQTKLFSQNGQIIN